MEKFKLTIVSLLLTIGFITAYGQGRGHGNNNGGNRGGDRYHSGQGRGNGHANRGGQGRRGGGMVHDNRYDDRYGYNAGASNRRGRGRTTTTTHYYDYGNTRGQVRRTRTLPPRPRTHFCGNQRFTYQLSSCGTFYWKIAERRRSVPGRWVHTRCGGRQWEPGYTTWVFVNKTRFYG